MNRQHWLRTAVLPALLLPAFFAAPTHAALIAHWNMEEGAGLTTADIAGGNTGTLNNMETPGDWVAGAPVPGGSNFALSFDGVNEQVTATGYKGVTGTSERSMSAWVKTSAGGNNAIMSWGNNVAGDKWVWRVNDNGADGTSGALRVEVNGGYSIGSTIIGDGNWHHVVAILPPEGAPNATDIRFYVDGKLESISGQLDEPIGTASGDDVRIGNDVPTGSADRFWNGQIDDARIYNHALTSKEVSLLATGVASASATLEYNASFDPTPANNTFEERWQASSGQDLNANGQTIIGAPAGSPTITSVYNFDGTSAAVGGDWQVNVDGDPTAESASFEVWFRPSDLVGNEVVAEVGGNGNGVSFTLANDSLRFLAKEGGTSSALATSIAGIDHMMQAVGVIDLESDLLSLYLNGELISSTAFTGNDWAGNDAFGLGGQGGGSIGGATGVLGSLAGFGNFQGTIGFFRLYEEALTAEDVRASFQANQFIPEPATATLGLMGIAGLLMRRRRLN